jgi:hypothetical protein
VSPELRDLIAEHRRKLRRVLDDHRAIFAKLEVGNSGLAERESAATALHSFYTGIEFIMRAVATAYDGPPAKAGDWHATLLVSMAALGPRRPALLSPAAADALGRYLDFRHRFRNIYGVELSWNLMRPLVLGWMRQ